jgi:hypothetical protein
MPLTSGSGTFRTCLGELTMSAPKRRADRMLGFDRIYEYMT